MKHISYHSFSVYIRTLGLAIILGVSPVQNIFASVSGCMEMDNMTMHHQISASTSTVSTPKTGHDCCNKNDCNSTHCTTSSTAGIVSTPHIITIFSVNKIFKMSSILLTHVYPPTLYRPPKI